MDESTFWRTQPKRLKALLEVHAEVNNVSDSTGKTKKSTPRLGYIDQVL